MIPGALIGVVIGVVLVVRLATERPVSLAIMAGLAVASVGVRPWLLRRTPTEDTT